MNTNRPSAKAQKSRKGKKAWRKNIDLDTFEQGIEDRRETDIVLGPTGALFEVDTEAHEEDLTSAMRGEKKLKSQEILYKRSAIPGLAASHKKKEKSKSKPKTSELLKKAGRNGEDATKARIEQDGLDRAANVDIWDSPSPVAKAPKRKITEGPQAPIQGEVHLALPHGGKSYNPDKETWKDLIISEHKKLEKIEEEQELLEAERRRIEELIIAGEEKEEAEEEPESDDEPVEEFSGSLSVNAPVKNKKKTKQQRAKAQRQREQEALHKRLKELNKLRSELERIKVHDLDQLNKPGEPRNKKYRGLRSKHSLVEAPIEVKLSDEIEGSLRRLKPEGDLAKERFGNFQARGIIEARVPVKTKRRYAKRVTEKWTYKDFNKNRPHGQ